MKITVPSLSAEDREKILRGKLVGDRKIMITLVFCFQNNPATVTEILKEIETKTMERIDRNGIYYALKRLQNWGIVAAVSVEEVIAQNLNNTERGKKIMKKWRKITEGIPETFQKRFNKMIFFSVNDENLVRFCAEKLGYGVKDE